MSGRNRRDAWGYYSKPTLDRFLDAWNSPDAIAGNRRADMLATIPTPNLVSLVASAARYYHLTLYDIFTEELDRRRKAGTLSEADLADAEVAS